MILPVFPLAADRLTVNSRTSHAVNLWTLWASSNSTFAFEGIYTPQKFNLN